MKFPRCSLPTGCRGNFGLDDWLCSALIAALRRNCPEVWVRRQWNFNSICGTFSWFAAQRFPSVFIFGAFRADTNFLLAARGRETHQFHKFAINMVEVPQNQDIGRRHVLCVQAAPSGIFTTTLYPAVTCSVMCRLRNTESFGCCRIQRCWLDSGFTFPRQFTAILGGNSPIFYLEVDSVRLRFFNG